MKFIVSTSALLKQLSGIHSVISSNPMVPILENFLCEVTDGQLKVTASDLQTTMVTEMEVEAKENGSIAVPARILMETLRNLPEQPVTFSIDDNTYFIEIISENGRYKLAGENAADFPKIPEIENVHAVDIPSAILNKAVTNTLIATGTDELRQSMSGVFVKMDDTSSTFVATDGHRLVRYRRVDIATEEEVSIIIPRKALNILKATLPAENSNVVMKFNTSNAFFQFNNYSLICRLIDEKFPDYENVIPNNNPNIMTIDRLELLSSLKRISIYANKTTHQVRLNITGSELQISAEDLDFSNEAKETLQCDHEGEDIEIGFNAKFLIEMLNLIETDKVRVKLDAPDKAGLFVPDEMEENEDILMLAMPVMLKNYA